MAARGKGAYVIVRNGGCIALALAWPLAALDRTDLPAYLALIAGAAGLGCVALSGLMRADAVASRVPLRAHELLVLERLVLAAAFIAAAGPAVPALAMLAATALATIALQAPLRARMSGRQRGLPAAASPADGWRDIARPADSARLRVRLRRGRRACARA